MGKKAAYMIAVPENAIATKDTVLKPFDRAALVGLNSWSLHRNVHSSHSREVTSPECNGETRNTTCHWPCPIRAVATSACTVVISRRRNFVEYIVAGTDVTAVWTATAGPFVTPSKTSHYTRQDHSLHQAYFGVQ